MSLRDHLADLIRLEGPLAVSRYMDLCLHDPEHGYYATRPALGEGGDFLTAPMVSQVFGELLGLWAVEVWRLLGRPDPFRLVELGPGEGVMMADALRAARVCEGFTRACEIWLVETSAPLRARQAQVLVGAAAPAWAARLEDVPGDRPVVILANEFLDCLPIDQAVRTATGWRERRIGLDDAGALAFVPGAPVSPPSGAPDAGVGTVAERSPALEAFGRQVGTRVASAGGAALFVDYGRGVPGFGDTLQALRGHRKESPLARPGEADLTAHVDFPAFLAAARAAGARTTEVVGQGAFLLALGVKTRAAALARSTPDQAAVIGRQVERLLAPGQMGELFKVAAILAPGLAEAPGLEAAR